MKDDDLHEDESSASEAEPEAGPVDTHGEFVSVATNPFAAFLLRFYWVPVLVYVLLALHAGLTRGAWYSIYQWSYVPAHLLGFGLASHLLRRRTPALFRRLVGNGALAEAEAREIGAQLTRRMNGLGCEMFSIVTALAFLPFSLPDVLLAYLLGQVIWKACALGLTLHQLGAGEKLRLRPFHPDGCAGLASIGQLCFRASLVLIVSGTFLSFWLIYETWIAPGPGGDPLLDATRPFFYIGLLVVAICTLVVFLVPLWSTHRIMERRARELEARYDQIARELAEREEDLLVQGPDLNRDEFARESERIHTLRTILERGRNIPRWPIPVQTKFRFAAAQIPMTIGLAASIQQLIGVALNTLAK